MHTFTTTGSTFTFAKRFRVPGDYTLRAFFPTDPRNIAGESDSLTLEVQQKQLPDFTIASSQPIAPEGTAVTISGVLDAAATTTPKPTTQVTLYGKQNGGTFEALATTVTGTGVGDPGLEPGTSSLSEKLRGETSDRKRRREATKGLLTIRNLYGRLRARETGRSHLGGRGMDVLRRVRLGYPGGHAPGGVRPNPGRMGHLWRHPGGGRERSPGVARGVVPAVPCGARPPLRRA